MSHVSNRDDLSAINSYVTSRSQPAAGAPPEIIKKWEALVAQWKNFYSKTMASWYVSDADLATGKSIRNALMQNQNPDAWKYVQETAADKPGRKPHAQRPDAPKASKDPWKAKGLTYSGKYRSGEDVKVLQRKINAAGYTPPLKVDGKYGPGTQAGERWLSLQGGQTEKAAKEAAKEIARQSSGAPKPKVKPATAEPADTTTPPKPGLSLLGIPVNLNSMLGAAAGLAGGLASGGPIGAAIGTPLGFLGAAKLFPKNEEKK
jgi:hypothetical protein